MNRFRFSQDEFEEISAVGIARVFRLNRALPSMLGPVYLDIEVGASRTGIDAGHLALAASLVAHFRTHQGPVMAHLHRSYEAADGPWLDQRGIPRDLAQASVAEFVSDLRLAVASAVDDEEDDYLRFCARLAWDEEHGLYLSPDSAGGWVVEDY